MKILFVYSFKNAETPARPVDDQCNIQIGISIISSVLKQKGHETDLLVVCNKTTDSFISDYIDRFQPELICFSFVFSEYDLIVRVAEYIKKHYPEIYMITGGVHASLNPEEVIDSCFDAICINEGEEALPEFVEKYSSGEDYTKVENIWCKGEDGAIYKNPTRPFIQDLDVLPFPDRQIWQKWIKSGNSRHSILLGRGCPFECTYCCNHVLKKLAGDRYVRFRSPANILLELEQVVKDFPDVRDINLRVETIGLDRDFTLDLFGLLKGFNASRKRKLCFEVNMRIFPNCDYDEIFKAMKEANVSDVCIGLESGSERVREEVLNRRYSNDDYFKVVELAKSYGLRVNIYVLVGVPGETLADFKETVYCARKSQPDDCWYSIFFPYPGTVLYKYCKDNGLLPDTLSAKAERIYSVLDLPGFSRKQIQKEYDMFYYNVYKGYRPMSEIIRRYLNLKRKVSLTCRILLAISPGNIISILHRIKHKFIKGSIFGNSKSR